jgi:hypothetical protein
MSLRLGAILLLAIALAPAGPAVADSPTARTMYTRALEQERELRDAARQPTLPKLRRTVNAYDTIVRRFPASGYCDNALWQGGNLALLAYERFGEAARRGTGAGADRDVRRERARRRQWRRTARAGHDPRDQAEPAAGRHEGHD